MNETVLRKLKKVQNNSNCNLTCMLIVVMFHFLERIFFMFYGISTVVLCVNNSGGAYLLKIPGKSSFFLGSKLYGD